LDAGKATIAKLIPVLESVMERTILDKTGFTRTFNAKLVFNPLDEALPGFPGRDDQTAVLAADLAGLSFFRALEDQLGLKLESRRRPVEVLVIDSVDRPDIRTQRTHMGKEAR
jgi:uncharacterized protein (TIGR03435 family)